MYPRTHTTPTARREHRCDHCERVIAVGEKYDRDEGKQDDFWLTWKTCTHCAAVYARIWKVDRNAWDDDYGLDLAEYLNEYLRDGRLRALFKAGWAGTAAADLPLDEIVGGS